MQTGSMAWQAGAVCDVLVVQGICLRHAQEECQFNHNTDQAAELQQSTGTLAMIKARLERREQVQQEKAAKALHQKADSETQQAGAGSNSTARGSGSSSSSQGGRGGCSTGRRGQQDRRSATAKSATTEGGANGGGSDEPVNAAPQ